MTAVMIPPARVVTAPSQPRQDTTIPPEQPTVHPNPPRPSQTAGQQERESLRPVSRPIGRRPILGPSSALDLAYETHPDEMYGLEDYTGGLAGGITSGLLGGGPYDDQYLDDLREVRPKLAEGLENGQDIGENARDILRDGINRARDIIDALPPPLITQPPKGAPEINWPPFPSPQINLPPIPELPELPPLNLPRPSLPELPVPWDWPWPSPSPSPAPGPSPSPTPGPSPSPTPGPSPSPTPGPSPTDPRYPSDEEGTNDLIDLIDGQRPGIPWNCSWALVFGGRSFLKEPPPPSWSSESRWGAEVSGGGPIAGQSGGEGGGGIYRFYGPNHPVYTTHPQWVGYTVFVAVFNGSVRLHNGRFFDSLGELFAYVRSRYKQSTYGLDDYISSCNVLPNFPVGSPVSSPPPPLPPPPPMDCCEDIKDMFKSLKGKIKVPKVTCELVVEDGKQVWTPKIEEEEIFLMALDEETLQGFAKLHMEAAQLKADSCYSRNWTHAAITLPRNMIKPPDPNAFEQVWDWLTPDESETVTIRTLPQMIDWAIQHLSGALGDWGQEIVLPGDENGEGKLHIPDIGTGISQIILLLQALQNDEDTVRKLGTRSILEAHLARQQATQANYGIEAILKYLAPNVKREKLDLPATFDNPNPDKIGDIDTKAELDNFLRHSHKPIPVLKYDDQRDFKDDLKPLLDAASVIMAVFAIRFKKDATDAEMGAMFRNLIDSHRVKAEPETNDEDWDAWLNKAEQGFTTEPGITDPINPYGRDLTRRPRIREIGTNQADP